MSNKISLNQTIRKIIEEKFRIKNNKKIKIYNSDTVEAWDSLGHMLLIEEIEKKFNISVSQKDVVFLQSEKSLVGYLSKKIK
jgi:acyl carrier protein